MFPLALESIRFQNSQLNFKESQLKILNQGDLAQHLGI